MTRPKTRILVDGGDPQETRRGKELLGFVDGQTTNPSLIAKNPHIKELIASGHKLSNREEMDEYRKIVTRREVGGHRNRWEPRCARLCRGVQERRSHSRYRNHLSRSQKLAG
jgi:hypothetical protein